MRRGGAQQGSCKGEEQPVVLVGNCGVVMVGCAEMYRDGFVVHIFVCAGFACFQVDLIIDFIS